MSPKYVFLLLRYLCRLTLISSQLYQEFAEPLNLPIMKLLIFHVSEHRDESMVRPIWNNIFEEGEHLS